MKVFPSAQAPTHAIDAIDTVRAVAADESGSADRRSKPRSSFTLTAVYLSAPIREQSTLWLALLRSLPIASSCLTKRLATFRPRKWRGEGKAALMANGTVKWFNTTKGFGFIMPGDGGKDVFVHITAVQAAGLRGLNDGQAVIYDVVMERGKAAATNLKLA